MYKKYGIKSFNEYSGMFATAIVDVVKEQIILSRDREGIKPLYYLEGDGYIAFSSSNQQLASLFQENELDTMSLKLFLILKYIPAPMTGFKKIKKLKPGEIKTFSFEGKLINSYKIKSNYFELNKLEKINTRELIIESVKDHLNSDLKICSLLSGGIDSSIITFEARELLGTIDTFTAYQDDPSKDQDVFYASLICKEFDCNHNLIKIPSLCFEKIYNPLKKLSEPSGDPAFITGYYLMQQIKDNKVFLSGDGADELFGGYGIKEKFENRTKKINTLNSLIDYISSKKRNLLPNIIYKNKISKRFLKFLDQSTNDQMIFLSLYSGLPISIIKMIMPEKYLKRITIPFSISPKDIQEYELNEFMPNYFLNKVDAMSMLNSVEIRNPFISGEIRKYNKLFINNGYSNKKDILLETYKEILPKEIINRTKIGFTRNLTIFQDDKRWREISNQIPLDFFEFIGMPLNKLVKFSMNNCSEGFEIRWRLFSLISWLAGNKLIKDFEL